MKNSILFVYNAVLASERTGIYGECATFETVEILRRALAVTGSDVYLLNARSEAQVQSEIFKLPKIDLAFVIAEGFLDEPDTLIDGTGSQKIRAVIQEMGIPTSHTGIAGMEICRNKDFTYDALRKKGIKVPGFFTLDAQSDLRQAWHKSGLSFPLFVKPAGGGNSVGISENSIVNDFDALQTQTQRLFDELGEVTLLVETYLSGQEFTIGVLGGCVKTVLPIVAFPEHYKVRSNASKKKEFKERELFQIITSEDPRYWQLYDIASNTFDAALAEDIIRLEVREDANKELYVIDVNGTPSLSLSASLTFMAEYLGITFPELINLIVLSAFERYKITPSEQLLSYVYVAKQTLRAYGREIEIAG